MTVIVGYVGRNGAVMASDSHGAEEDSTATTEEKIWSSGGLLFGYSGHVALRDRIRAEMEKQVEATPPPPQMPLEIAASSLCATIRPILESAYSNYVGAPGDDPPEKIGGSLMVIGFDGEGYWLLEIDRRNLGSPYTDDGFHTIGTGSVAAHVGRGLLKHYNLPGYEVPHLRLLAYRTVSTCIDVLGGAYMLGGPVQLWHSVDSRGFERVLGDKFDSVKEGVRQWAGIEQESLDGVFSADKNEAKVDAEAEPLPEKLDDGGEENDDAAT